MYILVHVPWFSPLTVIYMQTAGDETAVWCMYGDQVPVNLRAARKSTGIT